MYIAFIYITVTLARHINYILKSWENTLLKHLLTDFIVYLHSFFCLHCKSTYILYGKHTAVCKVRHMLNWKCLYCKKDYALFRSSFFAFFIILHKICILLNIKDLEYKGSGLPAVWTRPKLILLLFLSLAKIVSSFALKSYFSKMLDQKLQN